MTQEEFELLIAQKLQKIPEKSEYKDTTTHQWKKDLVSFIKANNIKSVLEIGSAIGYTSYIISSFVDNVTSVEFSSNRMLQNKTFNKSNTNIIFFEDDVYNTPWNKYGYHDLVIVDCNHQYDYVVNDIRNAVSVIKAKYIAFDDYGLYPDVYHAVNTYINNQSLEIAQRIGAPPQSDFYFTSAKNKTLVDYEGVICRVI